MNKLKTISQFRLYTLLFLLLAIINVILNYDKDVESIYDINTKEVIGTITDCYKSNENTKIIINGQEKILISYQENFTCKFGIKIKAYGEVKEPQNNTVFYLFNYKNYLLSQNINYLFYADNVEIINNDTNILYKFKNFLIEYINTFKSKDHLLAFILGDDSQIDEKVIQSYQQNGITHLLAISGMNIAIIAGILLFVLKFFSKDKAYFIVIIFLILYMFLTNFSPSVVRACLLFILITINKALNLKLDTLSLLILILSFLLIINPYYIYNIGFLLSFAVSFYLIVFSDLINKYKSFLLKNLMLSLIAFLASAPILINNFFHLNFLAPIISIIFVPLVSILIYPLSLLTLLIKPLDDILYFLLMVMENLSLKIDNISFLDFTFREIGTFGIIIYYLIISFVLYKSRKNLYFLLILVLVFIVHHNINFINPYTTLTVIDVGQGDSLLLKLNNNKGNILIDTGGNVINKDYDIARNRIIPYLKAEGITGLDYLILTHGDFDHAGMANNLINNFKVEKVIFNNGEYNDLELEIIQTLENKNIFYYKNVKKLSAFGNKLYFLNNKIYDNENDNSNVIYTEINGIKLLLMGDAGKDVEEDIISKYNLNNIDILKVGHHGSETSTSLEFVNYIKPKFSSISVGKNNIYGHPNYNVLENLKKSTIYRTDINGSIKFILNENMMIKTCNF